jgi:dCTP deaminase
LILSDRDIRKQIESGRLIIEPFEPDMVQPSSVDLRVDRIFRVFRNTRYPYIDVRSPMEDLTDVVEVTGGEAFILHPGEFVLGSTLERVHLPDDLVGRIEGKSSLGRLGLLIHSSLPGSEPVVLLENGALRPRPIAEIVEKRIQGSVVGFDPETFSVGYHRITGWYEGPPDRIFEVVLASGRSIRVTGGHSLFTLDGDETTTRVRTLELLPGTRIATTDHIPEPANQLSDGAVAWNEVGEVLETGAVEPVYDLEVRPEGRPIENFLAGRGGVFASNTAGFVDAGWTGHLTLELSNVANLPITIYPGMKIGQLCLFEMTSPAERPYGERGKYQGQRGPTPSKFHLDFKQPVGEGGESSSAGSGSEDERPLSGEGDRD